ncbi:MULTISPECIES: serine/threonine-protein kinase [Protofrankia]|uniref:non-specific serine/threonine protein kinase n=1 Tax=Candidatus Protofrankia datiscae TaxID=2716812 RepID=F8B4H9_9ACTN|nr:MULTISPECIES: serine/threonine-protein kinase [Protofrankia]AEH07920.1 serine/threonine protein kinase [Candidatus Protofrankia datiscae]
MTRRTGSLVAGRYRLVESLGAGGMGTVWRAVDEVLSVEVAVKELNVPSGATAVERERWIGRAQREAKNIAKLRHNPHIVTILDVVVDDGMPWIIMELVPSARTLADAVRTGALPAPEVARIGLAVLDALTAAHHLGVTHRDVKPANILLAPDGRVVLIDFGLALHDSDPTITQSGFAPGTPAYMAPERFAGERLLPASDLFSLGATLYHAAEGRRPFERSSWPATMHAVLYEDPPAMRTDGNLVAVVLGLLVKDPGERMSESDARRRLARVGARSTPAAGRTAFRPPAGLPDEAEPAEQPAPRPRRPDSPPARRSSPGRAGGGTAAGGDSDEDGFRTGFKPSYDDLGGGVILTALGAAPWLVAVFAVGFPWWMLAIGVLVSGFGLLGLLGCLMNFGESFPGKPQASYLAAAVFLLAVAAAPWLVAAFVVGYAWWLDVIGVIVGGIATLIAIACVVLFFEDPSNPDCLELDAGGLTLRRDDQTYRVSWTDVKQAWVDPGSRRLQVAPVRDEVAFPYRNRTKAPMINKTTGALTFCELDRLRVTVPALDQALRRAAGPGRWRPS